MYVDRAVEKGITQATPPGYLWSGTLDTTAQYQWSVDTANAINAAGGCAVFYSEPGVGHTMPDLTLLATQTDNVYCFVLDLSHASS